MDGIIKPKKILVLTLDFPPAEGGIQNFSYNFCKHLKGFEIKVIAPYEPDAEKFDMSQSFIIKRVKAPPFQKKIFILFMMFLSAMWDILFNGYNLIVCMHPFIAPMCAMIKVLLRIPYVSFAYGRELRSKNFQRFGRFGLKNGNLIITISEWTSKEVLKFGIRPEKIVKINPAVDPKKWEKIKSNRRIIEEYKLNDKRIILTVSRLEDRYKGQDMVIKAMALISSKFPDARYVIVGDGPLRPYLEKLSRILSCDDKVIFTGRLSDEELKGLYEACDVFIMASRESALAGGVEGFGIVFLEANLFGKPVIGGRSGGIPDAVIDGRTGFLVNPEEERDIADAIIKLLTDRELRERLGKEGKERVLNELTWEKVIGRIEKELERVVNSV